MKALVNVDENKSKLNLPKGKKTSIALVHDILIHVGWDQTRATAEYLEYEIRRGLLHPCEACTMGKAKQKNIPKAIKDVPATKTNENMILDISTIK